MNNTTVPKFEVLMKQAKKDAKSKKDIYDVICDVYREDKN